MNTKNEDYCEPVAAFNDAMKGKQMDNMTFQTAFMLYFKAKGIIEEALKDEDEDVKNALNGKHFDSALRGCAMMAALGRDEKTMTPADSIGDMFQSLIATKDTRIKVRDSMFSKATENALANVHVMPCSENENGNGFPTPFNHDAITEVIAELVANLGGTVIAISNDEEEEDGN